MKIFNESNYKLEYATPNSAGIDLHANIENPITIAPLERVLIPTGIHIALPNNYEAQIRPRSGLALKHGITVLNTPGTIDADFRGDIGIILINLSTDSYVVNPGDRIAQMIIAKFTTIDNFEYVNSIEKLGETERGEGGFGHSGK